MHTFQLQLRSELSPVAATEIQHLNVDYFTDMRHNNSTGLKRTRACARFPRQPVSQLLNTFKSTTYVLFVATGARNAIERWTVFFFFLTATEGYIWRKLTQKWSQGEGLLERAPRFMDMVPEVVVVAYK